MGHNHKSDNEVLRKTRDIINMYRQSLGIVVKARVKVQECIHFCDGKKRY